MRVERPTGSSVDVTITGNLTNWVQGTTEAILGAGVSIGNLTITSPTTATAEIAFFPRLRWAAIACS